MEATENRRGKSTRETLILAGLEELNEYGVQHFSTRRVAKACGVSCAAPYKHLRIRTSSSRRSSATSTGSMMRNSAWCWKSTKTRARGSSWSR